MREAVCDPGSFRDPAGYVFRDGGKLFRAITAAGEAQFEALRADGFLNALVARGALVPFTSPQDAPASLPVAHGHAATRVIEIAELPLITYPYEWCFGALKAAALFQLDLIIEAIDRGFMLSDASAYNIQFQDSRPIFIDHLSLRPYFEGEYWIAHDQFMRQFYNPLALEALADVSFAGLYRGCMDGVPSREVLRSIPLRHRFRPTILVNLLLPAFFDRRSRARAAKGAAQAQGPARRPLPRDRLRSLVSGLRRSVEGLEPAQSQSFWAGYASCNTYSSDAADQKRRFVSEAVAASRPRMLWDIGCNTGDYAFLALEAGADRVIGLEADNRAVEYAFRRAVERNARFLPLRMNVLNPSPSSGWRQRERPGLDLRMRGGDFILALALVHHLAFRGNVPLEDIVAWLVSLAPAGVIEFVPKQDPMVQVLLSSRSDNFASYTEEVFRRAVQANSRIVAEERLDGSGRLVVHYVRDP